MADENSSHLEPIEEADLDLKGKFVGDAVNPEIKQKSEIESLHSIEGQVERKEGVAEKEAAYTKILSKVTTQKQDPKADGSNVASDAAAANTEIDAESKIEKLVKLAEAKGIPHAVKVARHMEDNYSLDEFHDRLLGQELHDALVKKGMIKEI
jgi:hypothetical protein